MTTKLPITLVTGFLGAGKTTLINQLLTTKQDKSLAIIINEFGEIGVDHQLVLEIQEQVFQMNNGCLCCNLRSDIADVLFSIVKGQKEFGLELNHIILETTGLADPAPIAQTFFNVPELKDHIYLDSVLTLVDTKNILDNLRQREEPLKQIAFADKLILSKTETVPSLVKGKVLAELARLNPFVEVIDQPFEELLLSDFIGHGLFDYTAKTLVDNAYENHQHLGKNTDTPSADHGHYHTHEHNQHKEMGSFAIQETQALDITKTERWLRGLIATYGQQLYRYKGVLNIAGADEQLIFQGVNLSLQLSTGKRWGELARESTLVFIGQNLNQRDIVDSFYTNLYRL